VSRECVAGRRWACAAAVWGGGGAVLTAVRGGAGRVVRPWAPVGLQGGEVAMSECRSGEGGRREEVGAQ
jgi:hypothetical protein